MAYNPQFDLRGKRIEDTYNQILQCDTSSGNYYTGQGLQSYITASLSLASQSLQSISSSWSDQSLSSSYAANSSNITPAAPYNAIQFNNSNSLGGTGNFTIDSNDHVVIGGLADADPVPFPGPSLSIIGSGDVLIVGNTGSGAVELSIGSVGNEIGLTTMNDEFLSVKETWPSGDYLYGNRSLRIAYDSGSGNGNVSIGINITSSQNKLDVEGNISCSVITASLFNGTASYSLSSSYSTSASYASNAGSGGTTLTTGSTYSITSSWAVSASWAPGGSSVSSSWTSSSISASYALSASYSDTSLSASYAPGSPSISASYALSASYASNGGGSSGTDVLMVQIFS